jgi:hypothetical protein
MITRMITLAILMFISISVTANNDGRDKWPHKKSNGINYKKFHKKHHKAYRRNIGKCHGVD